MIKEQDSGKELLREAQILDPCAIVPRTEKRVPWDRISAVFWTFCEPQRDAAFASSFLVQRFVSAWITDALAPEITAKASTLPIASSF